MNMPENSDLLRMLKVPDFVVQLSEGLIRPVPEFIRPATGWIAYPPCFIPVYEYGSEPSYCGILKHWFCDRQMIYANLLAYLGYYIYEKSRSSEQFAIQILIKRFEHDEEFSEFLTEIGNSLAVRDVRSIYDLWERYEDGCYPMLDSFKNDWPESLKSHLQEEYHGDFPSDSMEISHSNLKRYCSIEICDTDTEFESRVFEEADSLPPWFKEENQEKLFYELLNESDLSGCWMTLNSRGWLWKDLRKALSALAVKANNQNFHMLCDCWLSQDHESFSEGF